MFLHLSPAAKHVLMNLRDMLENSLNRIVRGNLLMPGKMFYVNVQRVGLIRD
jgi:hypothetical protein